MSRLEFATQAEAQQCADSLHERMKATVPSYAASVRAGKTTAWAVPRQDYDADGKVIAGSPWCVYVKDRCEPVLTSRERAAKQDAPREARR